MKMIHSNIEINVSSDTLWDILLDFNAYPDWNPFITEIYGDTGIGSKLTVTVRPPDMEPKTFKKVVTMAWDRKQFRWLGRVGIPGLFDGEHMFILEELDPQITRFHQNEVFRGLLVPMFDETLENTLLGFNEMNKALKERAEKTS
ncbi:SRPBCC family protein [candidate division KSB1 bacterium]